MSAQPGEELGSEGKWFGDDYERNGLYGNTPTRFDELREELKPRGGEAADDLDQQFHPFQDYGKRPPVAMETASTDWMIKMRDNAAEEEEEEEEEEVHLGATPYQQIQNALTFNTPTLSNDSMSGLFRKPMTDDGDVYTSLLSNQSFTSSREASYLSEDMKPSKSATGSSALDDFSSETYSSGFNTKMTSDLLDDMPKSLLGSDKTESYNYMDISHGDEHHDQHQGAQHSLMASPVKITLTESQPPPAAKTELQQHPPPVSVSERENVLSVGLQGVPTVTLSEPEDDSPASTPNASPTQKEFPSHDMFKAEAAKPAASKGPGAEAGSRERDGSSAESGDSEIELVSEEPSKASSNPFDQPPKSKGAFSQPNNPFDNPPVAKGGFGLASNHAPPTAYSILREEREAELDSDLFIESASEESPKREQGSSGPKPGVSAPSPLVPSVVPPRSTTEAVAPEPPVTEKVKTPVKIEEDRPSKPKPPTATVPPEVRLEKPPQDDMQKHTNEGKGDLGKPAASMFLEGFNKQKVYELNIRGESKNKQGSTGSVETCAVL
ncbi:hypothetical protein INR49_030780 [Caranx melampygus]|nr:hypothetical protein INR49_030780 [Caranx melampygus]